MQTVIDLTDRFPMRFDVERMREELKELETFRWIDHYDRALSDGWTAVPLVSRHGRTDGPDAQRYGSYSEYRRTPVVDRLPYFRSILDAFRCPQGRVRILRLMPGTAIGAHRDIGEEVACLAFGQVRLHIPILTNDRVLFLVGGRRLRMEPGRLYYADFSKVHYVRNDSTEPRVHLVLDVRMNDYLRGVFPPVGAVERVEHFVVRHTLPLLWQVGYARNALWGLIWKYYEGSALQRLRHRLRGQAVAQG
jgi:hypothetical protein